MFLPRLVFILAPIHRSVGRPCAVPLPLLTLYISKWTPITYITQHGVGHDQLTAGGRDVPNNSQDQYISAHNTISHGTQFRSSRLTYRLANMSVFGTILGSRRAGRYIGALYWVPVLHRRFA